MTSLNPENKPVIIRWTIFFKFSSLILFEFYSLYDYFDDEKHLRTVAASSLTRCTVSRYFSFSQSFSLALRRRKLKELKREGEREREREKEKWSWEMLLKCLERLAAFKPKQADLLMHRVVFVRCCFPSERREEKGEIFPCPVIKPYWKFNHRCGHVQHDVTMSLDHFNWSILYDSDQPGHQQRPQVNHR